MYVLMKDDKTLFPDRVEMSSDVFASVSEKFGPRCKKPVSVLSSSGELMFNLCWESEQYSLSYGGSSIKLQLTNYAGEDLCGEYANLDMAFPDLFDVLWFDEINEYSRQIIRLMNRFRPEKTVLTGDDRIRLFPEIQAETAPCPDENDLTAAAFFAGHQYLKHIGNRYSVYSLMANLCWAKDRLENPGAAKKGTVLLVDFWALEDGLGDIVKKASAFYKHALALGWIPVICLNHGSQYADFEGEDCWGKFFEPAGEILPDDVYDYSCVISVFGNRGRAFYDLKDPVLPLHIVDRKCAFPLRISENALETVLKKQPDSLTDPENSLGLIIRTTDFDWHDGTQTDVEDCLRKAAFFAEKSGASSVFLATESEDVLEKAKDIFGEKFAFIPQKRVRSDGYPGGFLSETLGRQYDSGYEKGSDYLAVLWALSECGTVLYNRICGAEYLARSLKEAKGKPYSRMFSLDLAPAVASVLGEKRVILYGAGTNGRSLLPVLKEYGIDFCFCDQKAEEEYMVEDVPVISLSALKEIYRNEIVLVTPYYDKDAIFTSLTSIGIPLEKLIWFYD